MYEADIATALVQGGSLVIYLFNKLCIHVYYRGKKTNIVGSHISFK